MSLDDFIALYTEGILQQSKEKAWERWLAMLPGMTEETYENFDDYWERLRGHSKDISEEEEQQGYYIDQLGF